MPKPASPWTKQAAAMLSKSYGALGDAANAKKYADLAR